MKSTVDASAHPWLHHPCPGLGEGSGRLLHSTGRISSRARRLTPPRQIQLRFPFGKGGRFAAAPFVRVITRTLHEMAPNVLRSRAGSTNSALARASVEERRAIKDQYGIDCE
jgi:hypothetical protein